MDPRRSSVAERRARADARRAERASIDDPAVVLDAAAAFLTVRPRSVAETRRRLNRLGYPAGIVDIVIERLIEMGYLDDEAFAVAWVESRDRARPRGEAALRRELSVKGIDREVIASVLAERAFAAMSVMREGDADPGSGGRPSVRSSRSTSADEDAARRLLARRSGAIDRERDPRRRRQKAYALLARHGFDPDVCARVSVEASSTPADAVSEGPFEDV